jgi:hypothetical protein
MKCEYKIWSEWDTIKLAHNAKIDKIACCEPILVTLKWLCAKISTSIR